MHAQVVSSSDLRKCPKLSLSATHYREDGSCRCIDRSRCTDLLCACGTCPGLPTDDEARAQGCGCETCNGCGFIRRETYGVPNAVVNCPDCPRNDARHS